MTTERPSFSPSSEIATRVCPHCGAMTQTASEHCPHCGKGYRRGSAWVKIAAVLGIVLLLGVAGCVAVVAIVADDIVNRVESAVDVERDKHDITPAQYRSIKLGTSERAVFERLGVRPRAEGESDQSIDGRVKSSKCVYYNVAGGELIDIFQFCFRGGKLVSKNRV